MSTSSKPQLIGLAGTFASGKDTLAKKLAADFGYTLKSSSDLVRQLSKRRHDSIERPMLFETASFYRRQFGPQVLIDLLLEEYEQSKSQKGLIISGLRVLGEANAIKANGGAIIFIDAPAAVRYERMKARRRDTEVNLTFAEFVASEQKEWHGGDSDTDFNLRALKAQADHVLDSTLPLDEFYALACAQLGLDH